MNINNIPARAIKYLILPDGMAVDVITAELLDDEGSFPDSNGCGSDRLSHALCWFMEKVLRIDLTRVWELHDGGYSVKPELKNADHKFIVDAACHHNINIALADRGHALRHSVGTIIHMVLVWKGNKAYYANVPGHVYSADRFM